MSFFCQIMDMEVIMTEDKESKVISRRDIIVGGGMAAAGAAIASLGAFGGAKEAAAYDYTSKYRYKKVDPNKVGQTTYENYFKRWCTSSVLAGFVGALQENKEVGADWKDFPIDAYRWSHGGFAGWGALCGTMPGAGIIIGLVTKDTDVAEAMTNDLAFYYAYTELPSFMPAGTPKAELHHMTIAGTPICHVSIGKWMRAEGVEFLSDNRAERCARVAANVAMETANMLNDWSDGKYVPKHKALYNVIANGITSQNNCGDCHGHDVPGVQNYPSLEK
jgi:hypothetical protein